MPKIIDRVGHRYGRLTVINRVPCPPDAKGADRYHARWLCLCDCGNTHVVRGLSLQAGDTKSCGCLKRYYHQRRRLKIG